METLSEELRQTLKYDPIAFPNYNFLVQEQLNNIADLISSKLDRFSVETVNALVEGIDDIYSTGGAYDLYQKVNLIASVPSEESQIITLAKEPIDSILETKVKRTRKPKNSNKDSNQIIEEFVYSYKQLLEENNQLKEKLALLENKANISNPILQEMERLMNER
jgi:hypothetical protein